MSEQSDSLEPLEGRATASPGPDDLDCVQRCQNGDADSLTTLRDRYHDLLRNALMGRGASHTEAGDLLADLWADCVPGNHDRPSLLEKFSMKCSLKNWLLTVATNRLIDHKRKLQRRGTVSLSQDENTDHDPAERLVGPSEPVAEHLIVDVLRDSLQAAFRDCPPEALLSLRLVYLHGLSQREVGRMFGWHESKVSRALSQAMRDIESLTLKAVRKHDGWLELTWQDFLDLCETHQLGFL